MSNHVDRGSGVNNTPEDDFVLINVSSTEFKNESQGGVIGGRVGSRLYLSQDGNVRLVQKNILMQQAGQLYDFDKGDWTPLGEDLVPDPNDRTNLLNATKIELQKEIARRKKSGVEQTDVTIGADSIIDASGEQTKEDENNPPDNQYGYGVGDGDPQGASIKELEELINSNYRGLHSSDRFLQRLSLKNLKYPLDADYGNTQDYIQIDQFTYQAPNPEILFGGEDTIKTFGNILRTGLNRESPKEKTVGLVKLPMPNDLKDSNNVAWGEDQLNAITAAAATLSAGGINAGFDILESIVSGDQNLAQGLSQALTGTFGGLKKQKELLLLKVALVKIYNY